MYVNKINMHLVTTIPAKSHHIICTPHKLVGSPFSPSRIQLISSLKCRFEAHMEVHVGSIDEEDDEQGIAHMIEHVAFLGSKKREKLLGTGARSNAYTDFHHTVFHIHSPTSTKVLFVSFCCNLLAEKLISVDSWHTIYGHIFHLMCSSFQCMLFLRNGYFHRP